MLDLGHRLTSWYKGAEHPELASASAVDTSCPLIIKPASCVYTGRGGLGTVAGGGDAAAIRAWMSTSMDMDTLGHGGAWQEVWVQILTCHSISL